MTNAQLTSMFPRSKVLDFAPFFAQTLSDYEIDTKDRLVMFFAQTGHETQQYKVFVENLNYDAQGLANTWPPRYAVDSKAKIKVPNKIAKTIQRQPVVIANLTYANRMGNGSVESGEGWKYRGRGMMHTTGKSQYLLVDNKLGMKGALVERPELLLDPILCLESACIFWQDNYLNYFADRKDVRGATKRINGSYNHLKERSELYDRIKLII